MERNQALEGDVALLALSGYEADSARLERAIGYFQDLGHRVLVLPDPGRHTQRFAASEAERLDAFCKIAAKRDLGLVLGLRGGYGLTRLLPHLDFHALFAQIQESGTRWVGHSDWTVLELGLLATTGGVSFAGPMAAPDFGVASPDGFMQEHFWQAMRGEPLEFEWQTTSPPIEVEGVLWGGNLSILCTLIGTPFLPRIDGGILFLEDINEHPYRIERMLLQLAQTGILATQKAIVLGEFTGFRKTDYDQGFDLDAVFSFLAKACAVPLVQGLPFGHVHRKLTLPVGRRARLHVSGTTVSLRTSRQSRNEPVLAVRQRM